MPCGGRHVVVGYRIAPETLPVLTRARAVGLSLLQFWDCHAASWWPCTSAAQHSVPLPLVSTWSLALVQLLLLCNPKGWLLVEFISMLHLWSLWCTAENICNAFFPTTSLKLMNINLNLILFLHSLASTSLASSASLLTSSWSITQSADEDIEQKLI